MARSLTLAVISSSPSPLLLLDGEFAADMVRAVAYLLARRQGAAPPTRPQGLEVFDDGRAELAPTAQVTALATWIMLAKVIRQDHPA